MLRAAETRLVTAQAVMLEIGNALFKQPYRQAAKRSCVFQASQMPSHH